jgi:hypothetical protein
VWNETAHRPHNLLLEDPETSTATVLLFLEPHPNMPVWQGPGLSHSPPTAFGEFGRDRRCTPTLRAEVRRTKTYEQCAIRDIFHTALTDTLEAGGSHEENM